MKSKLEVKKLAKNKTKKTIETNEVSKGNFFSRSIRRKLLISTLPITLIAIFTIAFIFLNIAQNELKEDAFSQLGGIADSRAVTIEKYIQLRQEQAKSIAGDSLLKQLDPSGENDPQIIEKIQEHIDSIYAEMKLEPHSGYKDIDKASDIEIIGILDANGVIVTNTDKDLIGESMPSNFIDEVKKRGMYFGGFVADPLTDKSLLIILEDIRNLETNEFVGAVLIESSVETLNEILQKRIGLDETGETYLINRDYFVISPLLYHDDPILKLTIDSEIVQDCFEGNEYEMIYPDYRGVSIIGVSRYLEDLDWCMLSEIDEEEAFLPIYELQQIVFISASMFAVAISVIIIFQSKSMTRPLTKLKTDLRQIEKGNYSVKIQPQGSDEISDVMKSSKKLLEALKQSKELTDASIAELKKSDVLKEEFTTMVSHELKTPLTPIKGHCEMLLESGLIGELTAEQQNSVKEIERNTARLEILISDILVAQKLDMKKMVFNMTKFNLAEFIESVKKEVSPLMKDKEIEFVTNSCSVRNDLTSDENRLRQILENLVKNAVDFVPEKTGRIEIGTEKENSHVNFYVKDNGIGIPKAKQQNLFKKFYQVDTSHTRKHGGTGLGLVICKGLVEGLGGNMGVESEEGKGSTFYFSIPMNHEKIEVKP